MKRVKVLLPFYSKATGNFQKPDDIIEVTDEQLANIRSINVNMVLVLGEVEEEPIEEPIEEPKPTPKKTKAKTTK